MKDILNYGIHYNVRNMFGTIKEEIIERIKKLSKEVFHDVYRTANIYFWFYSPLLGLGRF
jgi:hypothetical protein